MSTQKLPSLKDKDLKPYEMLLHAIWTDERISSCCVSMKNVDQIVEDAHAARTFQPLKEAEMRGDPRALPRLRTRPCAPFATAGAAEAAGTDAASATSPASSPITSTTATAAEARRHYAELPESARDWKGADLAAARAACPNHLDFAELLPRAERYLA